MRLVDPPRACLWLLLAARTLSPQGKEGKTVKGLSEFEMITWMALLARTSRRKMVYWLQSPRSQLFDS